MNNKISVVINTYNAERHLAEVLDSVKDFDEIVVCDMESTDHTRDIALARGCRVVTFPKRDYVSAEPARTYAIQQASYHWVLVVDADEVTPSSAPRPSRRLLPLSWRLPSLRSQVSCVLMLPFWQTCFLLCSSRVNPLVPNVKMQCSFFMLYPCRQAGSLSRCRTQRLSPLSRPSRS